MKEHERKVLKRIIEENLANKEMIRKKVLSMAENKIGPKKRVTIMKMKSIVIPLTACLIFMFFVNLSPTFALAVSKVPVLGAVAKVITIDEYIEKTDYIDAHIKIPQFTDIGNPSIENQINTMIKEKMESLAEKAKQDSAEFKKNFLGEGEDAEDIDYTPSAYKFNYEVKSSNEQTLSFIINETETTNGLTFVTKYFYNIDLKTGKELTLVDILGPDYEKKVDPEIERQVKERAKDDANLLWYYEQYYASKGAGGIDEYTSKNFYINEQGNPVIFFYEYYIAPPYAGPQEFEIKRKEY
ncbi:DUF3298 and DUF4163 domain-containing protein [Lysinibacillus sp. NPDC093210]|uniref:DUF3298 and DUF4163 domain-containing protein n=1 Tax=Lysinibacillus sp. NPDC093210 TaxID=3364133 RepID=UPI003823E999